MGPSGSMAMGMGISMSVVMCMGRHGGGGGDAIANVVFVLGRIWYMFYGVICI